ncbi:hypothetical protein WN55_08941 [Dufourea novaeangliae]|uniref:Uncharacterized protein n=1 Tax=Dufourea novaeangliae TaxID=178035 RepID=A0A154P596_DUFNO|nr:hypothetical protein WN55_08941 [Dufourea novaeangliae]
MWWERQIERKKEKNKNRIILSNGERVCERTNTREKEKIVSQPFFFFFFVVLCRER